MFFKNIKIDTKVIFCFFLLSAFYSCFFAFYILPKVDNAMLFLETRTTEKTLNKISTLAKNFSFQLKELDELNYEYNKEKVENIANLTFSLVKKNYEKSIEKNIHLSLKNKITAKLEELNNFYKANKGIISDKEIQDNIISYFKLFSYNAEKSGYFFILDYDYNVVLNPSYPPINGKNLKDFKTKNGKYLIKEFVQTCKKDGGGFVNYLWLNPSTGKEEKKVSYVSVFKPYNWILGTGEYYTKLYSDLKDKFIQNISKIKIESKNHFIFILDYDGNIIKFIPNKKNYLYDNLDNDTILNVISKAKEEKNKPSFYTYKFNNSDISQPQKKLLYFKNYPNWNLIIGAGTNLNNYSDVFEVRRKKVFKRLEKILENEKIGKNGYLYIFDANGKVLFHPNSKYLNRNMKNLYLTDGKPLYNKLVKAAKENKPFIYNWDKPDDYGNYTYQKIVQVEYLPELGWYICSSSYLDEIHSLSNDIYKGMIIGIIAIFIILSVFTYFMLKYLLSPIKSLALITNKVAAGDYSVRAKVESENDFGLLAKNLNYMIGVVEDHIHNLDDKVKEATDFSEYIIDTAIEAILVFENSKCIKANDQVLTCFNAPSSKKLIGKNLIDFFPKEEVANILKELEFSFNTSDTKFSDISEATAIKLTGEKFPVLIKNSHIYYKDRDLVIMAFVDITDLKKKENELKLAKEEADRSSKIKSEFLANITHEIRTPMNAVIGMTELLLQTELFPKQKYFINKIIKSSKVLLTLINDILDLSKIEAGRLSISKEEFNLNILVNNAISIVEVEAKAKDLKLDIEYSNNLPREYFGDELRVSQILINLLSNAVKFTDKGFIKLTIQYPRDGVVYFEVRDTGIGISDTDKDKLFNNFTQADSSITKKFGGTGLGLSISKQLVKLMNGVIGIKTPEDNIGTIFYFEVELEPISSNQNSIENVLCLFNKEDNHPELIEKLESFKINTIIHENNIKIEEKLLNDNIDIIIVDVEDCEDDCIEKIKKINKIINESPLLKKPSISLLKKEFSKEILSKAKELNISFFLTNPVTLSELTDLITEHKYSDTYEITDDITTLKLNLSKIKNVNLLLVEDNKINQEVFIGLLNEFDYSIDIANNGKEALNLAKRKKYDIILMDIQMPIMDGYTATDLIKRIDQNNYIIGFSANSLEKKDDVDERFWFDDFIKKPVELKLLYKKLLGRFLKLKKGSYIQEEPELIQMENSPTRKDQNLKNYDLDTNSSNINQEIEYLNYEHAIKFYMGGNVEFYKKILSEFYQENQSIKLLDLTYSELKIKLHDLKSTSLSIGAENLHIMVKQKYTDVKIIELEEIQEELDKVLNAIKNYL